MGFDWMTQVQMRACDCAQIVRDHLYQKSAIYGRIQNLTETF